MIELQNTKIYRGNVEEIVSTSIEPKSVHLVITSPPYWGLRSYTIVESAILLQENDADNWINEKLAFYEQEYPDEKGYYSVKKFNEMKKYFIASIRSKSAEEAQYGQETDYRDYVKHIVSLMDQIKEVMVDTGSLYLNIGDVYCGSNGNNPQSIANGNQRDLPTESIRYTPRVKRKSLIGIPWRIAIEMIDEGWVLRNCIIWNKPNHMPGSWKDRLTNSYEFMFFFTKQGKYYYDLDAIREKWNDVSIKRVQDFVKNGEKYDARRHKTDVNGMAQSPYAVLERASYNYAGKFTETSDDPEKYGSPRARNMRFNIRTRDAKKGVLELKYEGIKKYNHSSPDEVAKYDEKEYSSLRKQDNIEGLNHALYEGFNDRWKAKNATGEYYDLDQLHRDGDGVYHPKGKNPGDVWTITCKAYKGAHFAVYPMDLVYRPVVSSSPFGGVVLDPFAGSGTTNIVSELCGRRSIGIELNPGYIELIKQRFATMDVQRKMLERALKMKTKVRKIAMNSLDAYLSNSL